MKNSTIKVISIIGLIALVYFLTNDIGHCAAASNAAQSVQPVAKVTTGTAVPSLHGTIIKFLYAMAGVVISSFLIFGGLTIYNRIFGRNVNISNTANDVLRTPKTKEDAIIFFIKKNKLT